MLTASGRALALGPLDQITQASLHATYPGISMSPELSGVQRATVAWGPVEDEARTSGAMSWTLPDGGTVAFIVLWAGNQARAFVPWAGSERVYFVSAGRVQCRVHGYANGDRVIFMNGAPVGLTDGVGYFVVGATQDDFQVAATSGGAPISILPQLSDASVVSKFSPATYAAGTTLTCAGVTVGFERAATVSAPVVIVPSSIQVAQGESYTFEASSPDGVPIVEWTLAQGQFQTGVSLNSSTGQLTVSQSASGTASNLRLRVKDSRNVETISEPFSFTVNAKPQWNSTSVSRTQGGSANLNSLCGDPEGQSLVFAAPVGLPAGFSLSGASLFVSQNVGQYSVTLSASDGINPPVLAVITVNVTELPAASGTFSATLALNTKPIALYPKAGVHWNRWTFDIRGGMIMWGDGDHGEAAALGMSAQTNVDGQARGDVNALRYFNDTNAPVHGIAPGQFGYLHAPRDTFRVLSSLGDGPIPPVPGSRNPFRTSQLIRGANASYPPRFIAYKVREAISGGKIRIIHGNAAVSSDSDPNVIVVIQDGTQPLVAVDNTASFSNGWQTQGPPHNYPYPDFLECPNGIYLQFVRNDPEVAMTGGIAIRQTTSYPPYAIASDHDNIPWLYSPSDDLMYWVHHASTTTDVATGGGRGGIFSLKTAQWTHGNSDINPYINSGEAQTVFWYDYVRTYRGGARTQFNNPGGWSEMLDAGFHAIRNGLWYLENNPDQLTDGKPRRVRRFATTWAAYPWTHQIDDKDSGWTNQYMNSGAVFGIWAAWVRPQRMTSGTSDPSGRDKNPSMVDAEMWAVNLSNPNQFRKLPHFPDFYPASGSSSSGPLIVYHPPSHSLVGVYRRLWRLDLEAAMAGNGQWQDVSPSNWPVNGIIDGVGDIKKSTVDPDPSAYDIVFQGDGTGVTSASFQRITVKGEKPQAKFTPFQLDISYPGGGSTPMHGKHSRFLYSDRYRDADTGQLVMAGVDGGWLWQFGGDYKGSPFTGSQVALYPVRMKSSDTTEAAVAYTSRRPWGAGSTYRGWRLGTGGGPTTEVIEIRNAGTSGVGPVIDTIPIGTLPGASKRLPWNAGIVCSAGIYISNPNTSRTCYAYTNDTWAMDSGRQDQWRASVAEPGGVALVEMTCNFSAFYPLLETEPEDVELSPWHPDGVGMIQDKRGDFWMGPGYYRFVLDTEPRSSFNDGIMKVYRFRLPGKHTNGVRRGDAWYLPEQSYLIASSADRVNVDDIVVGNAPPNSINGASNCFTCYDEKEDALLLIGQESHVGFYIYKFPIATDMLFTASASADTITPTENWIAPGDKVMFINGTPPTPLQRDTLYDALNITSTTIQVAEVGSSTPINITQSMGGPKAFTVDTTGNRILCTGHGYAAGTAITFVNGRVPLGVRRDRVYEVVNPLTNSFQIRPVGAADLTVLRGAAGTGCQVAFACTLRRTYAQRPAHRWTRQLHARNQSAFIATINAQRRSTQTRTFTSSASTDRINSGSSNFPHHLQAGDIFRFEIADPPRPFLRDHDYEVLNPTATSFQVGEPGTGVVIDIIDTNYRDGGYSRGCVIRHRGKGGFSVSGGRISLTGHGWIEGDRITFTRGAPPSPLVQDVEYEVAAGPTSSAFGVRPVGGGAEIVLSGSGAASCRITGPAVAYNTTTNTPSIWSGPQKVIGDYAYVANQIGGGSGAYRDNTCWLITKINLRNPTDVEYIVPPFHWVRGYDAVPFQPEVEEGDDGEVVNTTPATPQSINEYRVMEALGHRLVFSPPNIDYVPTEPLVWWFDTIRNTWGNSKSFDELRADAVAGNSAADAIWPPRLGMNKGGFGVVLETSEAWIMQGSRDGKPAGFLKIRVY